MKRRGGMDPKVSVVVPAYNAGDHIDRNIERVLAQTMPPGELEVIFVDDGSTDGTGERLDAVAAAHPHVRVLHISNSGWAGRPRNHGIEAAYGEYVYFVDADDHLGEEAAERMYAYGRANDADIVLGKKAGIGRGVPRALFKVNRPDATLRNTPLADSLTVHGMFRRDFLDAHKLRFHDEPKRLEDHLFMAHAYLHAERIAVLSDYVCYYMVFCRSGNHLSLGVLDAEAYYGSVREGMELVARHTDPGPERDQFLRRWTRVEMLNQMRGRLYLETPRAERDRIFDQVRAITTEHCDTAGVIGRLPQIHRIVSRLTIAGQREALADIARFELALRARATVSDLRLERGVLHGSITGELTCKGEPVTFTRDGDRVLLSLPVSDAAASLCAKEFDATAAVSEARIDLVLKAQGRAGEFAVPGEPVHDLIPLEAENTYRLVVRRDFTIRLDRAAAGKPLPAGRWRLAARVSACGWMHDADLETAPRRRATDPGPVEIQVGDDERPVIVEPPRAPRPWNIRRLTHAVQWRCRRLRRTLRQLVS